MSGVDPSQQHRRFAAGGNSYDERDPRDAEIERLRQRVRELETNSYDRYSMATNSVVNEHEDTDDAYENLFARPHHRQHHTPHRQHPRQPQQPVDPLHSLGLRTEIPEFEGRLQPDDFLDWLQIVERIFDLRDIPDRLKVIPMDACHVILGRPWLYDMRTKHDGFRNTYFFKKDGLHITLAPLNPRDEPQTITSLTKRDFVGLAKHQSSTPVFGLVIVEANPTLGALPTEVLPLVNDFSDIFPDDIPAGLPLMREIQHCIDFILGASIPKRPAYRMNPKEFAELQRQVTELLEKGLIRESMSPCAVPALLVPKPNDCFKAVSLCGLQRLKLLLKGSKQRSPKLPYSLCQILTMCFKWNVTLRGWG
uniref:Putative reverse transcriptase domain, zinc finger, CCHC-type, aspartic peptidase domain protein n=1 Tax=Tanacetum cinerariifolium TaxID=118510 RepID=A0A6L2MEN9_TANCI|nr:putative reverse transcriptase domain, zinc finger, CCHC-type, aspartic peptidase domain protein [Tanacetum cinerariifolium]